MVQCYVASLVELARDLANKIVHPAMNKRAKKAAAALKKRNAAAIAQVTGTVADAVNMLFAEEAAKSGGVVSPAAAASIKKRVAESLSAEAPKKKKSRK